MMEKHRYDKCLGSEYVPVTEEEIERMERFDEELERLKRRNDKMLTSKIKITLTRQFIEIEEDSNKIFLTNITTIQCNGFMGWKTYIYDSAHNSFTMCFKTQEESESFSRLLCDAYTDFIKLRSGFKTDEVRMVWE